MKNLFVSLGTSHQAKIPTKSGNFYLSVAAGDGMYSIPRRFIENRSYTDVEVAVISENGNWATKEQVAPLFPIIGEGEYKYWVEGSQCVFGYVPIELIQECIEAL